MQQGDLTEEDLERETVSESEVTFDQPEPKDAVQQFPFLINGVVEEDLWRAFFKSMARFDTKTLLSCRLVSKVWRDSIDRLTPLWSR